MLFRLPVKLFPSWIRMINCIIKIKPKEIRNRMAKPFLKWAGGKTQLLSSIKKALPEKLAEENFIYVEPFVGSGAVLFWMLDNFRGIKKAVINDINPDLINTYKIIASKPKELIFVLNEFQKEYHAIQNSEEQKKEHYYQKREQYNSRNADEIIQAALFIFLNKTCFNGLYRVNKTNDFNVPMGLYKFPAICDKENILAVSKALKKVVICCGDYEKTLEYAERNSFFYLDPPYKPLNGTSNFNAYAKDVFNDQQQIRLRDFCKELTAHSYKWMLSNADVKEKDFKNNFFDDIYSDFFIDRVKAKRIINSISTKRGELNELLITNYSNEIARQVIF
jgi:DNA adenine methylase